MKLDYACNYFTVESFYPEVIDGKPTGNFVAHMENNEENRLKLFEAMALGTIVPNSLETNERTCLLRIGEGRLTLRVIAGEWFTITA